jgi:Predicted ATPase related to phosphate starvation-inducible protein PhoH
MKLSTVNLAYPIINYSLNISHFHDRESTAIEGLILNAIKTVGKHPQYADMFIDALFNELFMIPDTDKLVLPCLLSLYDLGIIEIGIIDDHTRLSEVRLSELSLTELGLRMQREGILPGQRNESTDKISYDIKNGCLVDPSTRGQEEPFGIPVISPEVCSNIGFPIALIHEWLAEQQGKENHKLMWLDKTTTIESITPVKSQLMWKISSRQIQLKKGLVWHIADNNDVALDEKSLNDSDFGCPEVYHSLPYSEIDDPDTQIRQIASFRDADSLVSALAAENGVVFADINHFDPNCRFGTDKKSSVCIGVIWGAESFRTERQKQRILIYVPELDVKPGVICFTQDSAVRIERFSVKAGNAKKDMAFAVSRQNEHYDLLPVIADIADRYAAQDSTVLMALYCCGGQELLPGIAKRILSEMQSMDEKAAWLTEINAAANVYLKKRLFSDMDIHHYLIDCCDIPAKLTMKESAGFIRSFANISFYRMNDAAFRELLQLILMRTETPDDVEELDAFWGELGQYKQSHMTWICDSGLYKRFYTDSVIRSLMARWDRNDLAEQPPYSPFERALNALSNDGGKLKSDLPELDFYHLNSREKVREAIIFHREQLADIFDHIRKWKDDLVKLESFIPDYPEMMGSSPNFAALLETAEIITDVMADYYNDASIRYNSVFVMDTCALLHHPEIIKLFEDNQSLLVIPRMVLTELDGIKGDEENPDIAFNARESIRLIADNEKLEWLSCGEECDVSLLPSDINPDSNDSKILSVALRYIVKNPTLLTDDKNLELLAHSVNLDTISSESYINKKTHENKNGNSATNKKNKKKNRK